jgi:hypothetical protein
MLISLSGPSVMMNGGSASTRTDASAWFPSSSSTV